MSGTEITAEPGTPQIVMTRAFSATPEQVYRAHTDPDLIARWLGPERLKLRVETHEVRDGGRWRFVHIDEDGTEYGFHGVFHGTPSPQAGLVRTFEFEGAPGHVSLETLTLHDAGAGTTLVREVSVFQSVEARDAMIESGMESGVEEGYAKLDEVLASMESED